MKVGDRVRFNGVLIGVEDLDINGFSKVLLIHGSINGELTLFYLAVDDVDKYISRGVGISINGVGVVSSTNPLVIKPLEVL